MPYGEALHSLSDWYVQLLSESLGKMSNTAYHMSYAGCCSRDYGYACSSTRASRGPS